MSELEVGSTVTHIHYPVFGPGEVIQLEGKHSAVVRWLGDDSEMVHFLDDLKATPGGDTESPTNLGEEETMERIYEVEQSVTDAGGNIGMITGHERRDNGVFYNVLWEDGKESLNIQSVLQPVHETKAPTPKEVREVVEAVVHPPHYAVLDIIEAWDLNYSLGSVVQLVLLAGGTTKEKEIEDLKLAANLLKRRIDKLEAK